MMFTPVDNVSTDEAYYVVRLSFRANPRLSRKLGVGNPERVVEHVTRRAGYY